MKKIVKIVILVVAVFAILGVCAFVFRDKITKLVKHETTASDCVTLGDYSSISLKTTNIEKQYKSTLEDKLSSYVTYKQIKNRKVKTGDTVNIYYVGKVKGKAFDGGSCTKKTNADGYNLTIGSGSFIDGFEDQLVGATPGTKVTVNVTFPDGYSSTDLAGKKAVFTVDVNYIQGDKVYPDVTDDFVKTNFSTDYKSADDMTSQLRESAVEELAWEAVYAKCKVTTYPDEKIKSMYNQLYTSITYYLTQQGYKLSDYLSAQNTTSEDFKKQLTSTAKEDVGKQLVYDAIAEKEDITVSDKEYQAEVKEDLTTFGCDDEAALNKLFKSYYGTDAKTIITDDLLFKAVKKKLAGNVKES